MTTPVKRKWNPAHHPRDSKGRFTKSATRVMRPRDKRLLDAAVASFDFAETTTPPKGNPSPASKLYRLGGYQKINEDLRRGVVSPEASQIDAEMQPTDRDMVVTRNVPIELFKHVPVDQLNGMVVRDAAYAPTSIGPSTSAGTVRMRIAVPAGTRATVDGTDALLDRDTEMAVTRVQSNPDGSVDMFLVVLPKSKVTKVTGVLPGQADPIGDADLSTLTDEQLAQLHADTSSVDVDPAAVGKLAAEQRRRQLSGMTDDDLFDLFSQLSAQDDPDPAELEAVLSELDRREEPPTNEVYQGFHPDDLTPEQQQLDVLLDLGWDYYDAYEQVYGLDSDQLRREAEQTATIDRSSTESLDQAARRSYDEYIYLQYLDAESATRGHMLNAAGQSAGIDPVELFSGRTDIARKYASEDLLRWFADNGRMTFAEFKAQTLGRQSDKTAAAKTKLQGNARDFI